MESPQLQPQLRPQLRFEKLDGIVPVVVQDEKSREVLILAFMDREAWDMTIRTGYAQSLSRSRDRLWKKGETSGHVQEIREIRVDCDEDSVLLVVRQVGGTACHTGRRSCFYRRLVDGRLELDE